MSSTLAEILSALSVKVVPALLTVVKEAEEARSLVRTGEIEDDPYSLHHQLLYNRKQIERLEYLTSQMVLMKSRAEQQVASARAAYDDAYQKAATKPSVGFSGDYSTAKEKDAYYNLSTVDETIRLRQTEALHRDSYSAWDYCRILLRGAEGVQRDLDQRIRLLTMQGRLES